MLERDSLAFSPDGAYLYYSTNLSGNFARPDPAIFRVAVDGGEPEKLDVKLDRRANALRVHPDGSRIMFTALQATGELWVLRNFLPSEADK